MGVLIRGHEPGLYIGERGDIVCAEHAPSGDTWLWGHYIRITPGFEKLWESESSTLAERLGRPRCEDCGMTREEAERVLAG